MSLHHATGHQERPIRVTVLVDGPMEPLVGALRSAGLTVHDVLSALGIVTGEVAPRHLDRLRDVDGVLAVEEEREVDTRPERL